MIYLVIRVSPFSGARSNILGVETELFMAQSRAIERCVHEKGFHGSSSKASYHNLHIFKAEINDHINDAEFVCGYTRDVRSTIILVNEEGKPC